MASQHTLSQRNKLQQLLVKPKDPVSTENVVEPVCKMCEECETSYVGETERSLKSRFKMSIGDPVRPPQRLHTHTFKRT